MSALFGVPKARVADTGPKPGRRGSMRNRLRERESTERFSHQPLWAGVRYPSLEFEPRRSAGGGGEEFRNGLGDLGGRAAFRGGRSQVGTRWIRPVGGSGGRSKR